MSQTTSVILCEPRRSFFEACSVEITEGDSHIWSDVSVLEVIATAAADVEVMGTHVAAKEWKEDSSGGASPDEGVHEIEDQEIVDD